ncbi:MAG: molecular chaperone DnaK [bacterium]|nr:molecular chaperone DnaK [bacterium]
MSKILGIDLGTTNSAMAVVEGGEPRIIENNEGNRTTPSVVAMSKSKERLVGTLARRQAVVNPKDTLYSIKRLIGRRFDDEEVQKDKNLLPFEIRKSDKGGVDVKMGERWYCPEEISAMVLQKLKSDAEARLGEKIEEAVITVPAYFDDSQRQATKQAGEIAGLKVKRIINEPTAAALAYGLGSSKNLRRPQSGVGVPTEASGEKIVVYDFGGGTFDVSVLEVGDNTVEVKATGGDTHLGGDDLDQKILSHLLEEYKKTEGADLGHDALALQRLKEAAEKAKIELSSSLETEINLPYITSDASGPKHFVMKFTRAKLEDMAEEFIKKSIELVKKTMREAKLDVKEINEIVLVGGQTRMPAIQKAVEELFGKEAHKNVNPDEVVALGAAIQGGILMGDVKDILLLDVTPLTLSIETLGRVATPMIQKNTTVPTSKTQVFSTAADSQPSVEIHVLQGERPMAGDNKTLAQFILDGIPPAQRGVPQIEVTFDIDANGILKVSAKDKATGKEQSVRIEAATSMDKEEVEKLKREAEEHAAEDAKKKELIEAKNIAEQAVYMAEKALRENGEKINAGLKAGVEEKVKKVNEVKEGGDKEEIRRATEELAKEVQKIGETLYNANKEKKDTEEQNGESTTTEGNK